jgi:hypothetical protein
MRTPYEPILSEARTLRCYGCVGRAELQTGQYQVNQSLHELDSFSRVIASHLLIHREPMVHAMN